jgi:hypothetical protein
MGAITGKGAARGIGTLTRQLIIRQRFVERAFDQVGHGAAR